MVVVVGRPDDLPAKPPASVPSRDVLVLRRPIVWK
jgi:hypothetical protein